MRDGSSCQRFVHPGPELTSYAGIFVSYPVALTPPAGVIGTHRAVCHWWTLPPPRHPGPGWPSSTGRRAGGSGGACDGVRPPSRAGVPPRHSRRGIAPFPHDSARWRWSRSSATGSSSAERSRSATAAAEDPLHDSWPRPLPEAHDLPRPAPRNRRG